jgi:hypothetical protein
MKVGKFLSECESPPPLPEVTHLLSPRLLISASHGRKVQQTRLVRVALPMACNYPIKVTFFKRNNDPYYFKLSKQPCLRLK